MCGSSKKGFQVRSFGSGNQVKLPGPSPDRPNVYDFGTTYDQMYTDLKNKDCSLYPSIPPLSYTQNGILHMLDRNRRIKAHPERFQACADRFDVIFTAEERVFDQVVEELQSREPVDNTPVHIINVDIQDNHEEATIGAIMIYELARRIQDSDDLDNDIDDILQEFEARNNRSVLHAIQFY
ncbi:SSU72 [Cordylochernes scorpioides]|uniref:RNA polymerase II subunit A C-terminal domain phosphatase SSU72 n=1 Tax=Cordylochernes scorpioides TaxID=51811 RepID=A0ABY6KK06_9ARAC|nr:SSU72 [Cordylochernes scorpioides]